MKLNFKIIYNGKEIEPKIINFENKSVIDKNNNLYDWQDLQFLQKSVYEDNFKKRLYEGDIVEVEFYKSYRPFGPEKDVGIIKYSDTWYIKLNVPGEKKKKYSLKEIFKQFRFIKKIGNIYTNPEFLI